MDKKTVLGLLHEPKTTHEEIMFCIESTNDIVSKILEHMAECKMHVCYDDNCSFRKSNKE